jgi:hypothetical protein
MKISKRELYPGGDLNQSCMRTISLCVRGSPYANILASPYAYGDPRMGSYAYGDTRLDFSYGNIPRMHTVSD